MMNNLCYRLIERTKQQMQALGTDGGTGTAGKRTSKLTVTPAVTNGESLHCCLIVAGGWAKLSYWTDGHETTVLISLTPTASCGASAGGSHADEDLGKLLTRPDGLPDSIFIAKLLEADNKLLGGRCFSNMEVCYAFCVALQLWMVKQTLSFVAPVDRRQSTKVLVRCRCQSHAR